MRINLPARLDLRRSLAFCADLAALGLAASRAYTIDVEVGHVEPMGMLLTASALRRYIESDWDADHRFVGFGENNYAEHMGLYQSFFLGVGKRPGEAFGSRNYIPISRLNVQKLRSEALENAEHVGEVIERRALKAARVLSQGNARMEECLTFSIREMIRNIVEHSDSEFVWLCGQHWPSKDLVEVAILDDGVGLRRTLRRNPVLAVPSDEDALFLAIQPGVSGTRTRGGTRDPWANSGYGLYMTSSLCQRGGDFTLISGSKALVLNEDGASYMDTNVQGTAVRMRLKVSRIRACGNLIEQISDEGGRLARALRREDRISASRVARMLEEN